MQNNQRVTLRTRKNVKPAAVNTLILKEWQNEILKREIEGYVEKKQINTSGA
jgi:hypothetical protein